MCVGKGLGVAGASHTTEDGSFLHRRIFYYTVRGRSKHLASGLTHILSTEVSRFNILAHRFLTPASCQCKPCYAATDGSSDWGFCHPCGRPGLSFQHLALAGSSPGPCGHLWSESVSRSTISFILSL